MYVYLNYMYIFKLYVYTICIYLNYMYVYLNYMYILLTTPSHSSVPTMTAGKYKEVVFSLSGVPCT